MRFCIIFFFIASSAYAQYNLEFNQVLNFRIIPGIDAIVPEGKTWKITAVGLPTCVDCNYEIETTIIPPYGYSMSNNDFGNKNPVWLTEGARLYTTNYDITFSIIEFNLDTISGPRTGKELVLSQILNFRLLKDHDSSLPPVIVPDGKVWKIEGNEGDYRLESTHNPPIGHPMNGVLMNEDNINEIVWIGEGVKIYTTEPNGATFSIIEFNLINN